MAMKRGKNVGVMMPYADSLKFMSDWYCQLWAESLGKNVTLDGKPCNVGQTPVKALGVTDCLLYTSGMRPMLQNRCKSTAICAAILCSAARCATTRRKIPTAPAKRWAIPPRARFYSTPTNSGTITTN